MARTMQLRPYQVEGVDFLRRRKRAVLGDAPGLGKAQPLDAAVLTPYGYTAIGSLSVGDEVCSISGAQSAVTGVFPQGVKPTYRVTFSDGSSTECADDHLWCVVDWARRKYTYTLRVLKTTDIAATLLDSAGKKRYSIPLAGNVRFYSDTSRFTLDAYALGVLLGDGTLSLPHVVYLTTADGDLAERVGRRLPLGCVLRRTSDPISYRIVTHRGSGCNPVLTALRDLNLMGCRAETKHIPPMYLHAPRGMRIALLQGLLDTDGYTASDGARVELTTVSPRLAVDIKYLVQSLGGTARMSAKPTTYSYRGEKRRGQMAYRIYMGLPDDVVPFSLKRKLDKYTGSVRYPVVRRIKSVEYVGERDSVCISVSAPNGLYITNDFIVTHNTLCACEAAELPMLVSAPAELIEQWREFIEDQYPDWCVITAAYGNVIERSTALKQPFDVMLVNHDMHRRFAMPPVKTLVVDELHHFRRREAQRSKYLAACAHLTERVYGLTATPIYKDVSDLWHLLHVLDPKKFSSYWNFLLAFAVTADYGYGTKVIRTKNKALLDFTLKPYLLARTYKQVGMYLPSRIDKHVVLRMSDVQRKRYVQLRDQYRLEADGEDRRFFNAGAVLHELRALTVTDEKLAAIQSIVDDTPSEEPVLVFCWYRETAARLAQALSGVEITGDLAPPQRRVLARTGGVNAARVRVATMASLSEGVDLSDAHTVIFAEETYVPGQQYQALSRVVRARVGSDSDKTPVIAYWVRYAQTVDAIVHSAVERRVSNALTILREALA